MVIVPVQVKETANFSRVNFRLWVGTRCVPRDTGIPCVKTVLNAKDQRAVITVKHTEHNQVRSDIGGQKSDLTLQNTVSLEGPNIMKTFIKFVFCWSCQRPEERINDDDVKPIVL